MFLRFFKSGRKIFSIFIFLFLNLLVISSVLAQSPTPGPADYAPLVNVPGVKVGANLTDYLSGMYNFVISVVGILAMAVIVYGGMRYLTSAGNPAAAEEAKDAITSAIYGLVLAMASWLILNIVNPDMLVLKNPGVTTPTGKYSPMISTNKCVARPGTGTPASPCYCIDNPDVPVTFIAAPPPAASGDCQKACSDPSTPGLSPTGFHCLKLVTRIGALPDNTNIESYSSEQLRNMATTLTSADSFYTAVEGGKYIVDAGRYSTVLNTPATYRLDTTNDSGGLPDGVCNDKDSVFNRGDWAIIDTIIPSSLPSPYICKATQTPQGISCAQKVCVDDAVGNHAETTIFFTILAKP